MKKYRIGHLFIMLTVALIFSSCGKTDPIESLNDELDGRWEATSFMSDDNVERMTGDITKNTLLFQKDSIHTGIMSMEIVTSLVTLEGWTGKYTLTNDGSRLEFFDYDFSISIEDDILYFNLLDPNEGFDIVAKRKN